MGRVIKGSADSQERYTLAIPLIVAPDPVRLDAESFVEDHYAFAAPASEPVEPPPPPEPEIDFEAIAAQAQAQLDNAERAARALVDDARERANTILGEAQTQARALVEDTRRDAYDEGHAQGVREAEATMADMLLAMREIIEAIRDERHALLSAAEPELVRLAVGIAERVLHQQIALDQNVVVEMAKASIGRLVEREKITVRVNPADVERMREHREALLELGDVRTMRVIEDQRVDRGGVILETDGGSIDAKISTQLAEVRKILHVDDPPPASLPSAAADEPELVASRAS